MIVRFKNTVASLEAKDNNLTLEQVIKLIQKKHTLYVGRPASEVQILQAEKALKLDFPEPYRSFLANYGTLSFGSTEILGIASGHLDTTKATLDERRYNRNFPSDVFIVERLGIDGVLAVMTPDGMVRMVKHGVALEKTTGQPFLEYLTDAVKTDNKETS